MVIAVDLDGTLAFYDGWKGVEHIGDPVPLMLERVKEWLAKGYEVRIFTARVENGFEAQYYVRQWVLKHVGKDLHITNQKTMDISAFWDDRAVAVEKNTGRILGGEVRE